MLLFLQQNYKDQFIEEIYDIIIKMIKKNALTNSIFHQDKRFINNANLQKYKIGNFFEAEYYIDIFLSALKRTKYPLLNSKMGHIEYKSTQSNMAQTGLIEEDTDIMFLDYINDPINWFYISSRNTS